MARLLVLGLLVLLGGCQLLELDRQYTTAQRELLLLPGTRRLQSHDGSSETWMNSGAPYPTQFEEAQRQGVSGQEAETKPRSCCRLGPQLGSPTAGGGSFPQLQASNVPLHPTTQQLRSAVLLFRRDVHGELHFEGKL